MLTILWAVLNASSVFKASTVLSCSVLSSGQPGTSQRSTLASSWLPCSANQAKIRDGEAPGFTKILIRPGSWAPPLSILPRVLPLPPGLPFQSSRQRADASMIALCLELSSERPRGEEGKPRMQPWPLQPGIHPRWAFDSHRLFPGNPSLCLDSPEAEARAARGNEKKHVLVGCVFFPCFWALEVALSTPWVRTRLFPGSPCLHPAVPSWCQFCFVRGKEGWCYREKVTSSLLSCTWNLVIPRSTWPCAQRRILHSCPCRLPGFYSRFRESERGRLFMPSTPNHSRDFIMYYYCCHFHYYIIA